MLLMLEKKCKDAPLLRTLAELRDKGTPVRSMPELQAALGDHHYARLMKALNN